MLRAAVAQLCANGCAACPGSRTQLLTGKIEYFLSVFKGREDVYARRYHSTTTGKNGYTPVCKNEWVHSLCDKKKYKCAECPNREFRPLTADVVKAHLIGRDSLCRDVAAIYPMLEDNKT